MDPEAAGGKGFAGPPQVLSSLGDFDARIKGACRKHPHTVLDRVVMEDCVSDEIQLTHVCFKNLFSIFFCGNSGQPCHLSTLSFHSLAILWYNPRAREIHQRHTTSRFHAAPLNKDRLDMSSTFMAELFIFTHFPPDKGCHIALAM